MKSNGNMEAGYINEGGQLKTKNGQKYVVNPYRDAEGFYVTRSCAFIYIILFIIMMILTALLTYVLLVPSCANESANGSVIHAGSVWKSSHDLEDHGHTNGDGVLSDQAIVSKTTEEPLVEDEIEFHEGWAPSHYDLLLEPHIENSTSTGRVSILLTRNHEIKDLKPIVLDITDIEITDCSVFKVDNVGNNIQENVEYVNCEYGKNNASYVITFKETKKSLTNVAVNLEFTSKLTSTLQGFYKGSFLNDDTKEKSWFVSTQFSPIDCRRAFPSIDRPYAKATFKISIVRPIEKKTFMSNMPIESSERVRPGFIRENYKITPKMSTYLVAFHISDLKVAKESDPNDKSLPHIKMYARPEYENMTNFAYSLTAASLPFFERYFGIEFRLPKIDMVAVPDFGFSGMENWGLITFRESAMLAPENTKKSSSVSHLQGLAKTLVHEIAHQWFGNLVTMKWYDDLWLKEGFSTYLQYVANDAIKPEWEFLKTMTISEFSKAMPKDSDAASHPISFPVKTKSDIRRVFDPISYSKGALIINMMRSFLGETTFRVSLKNYLNKFEYGNAVQDDLWDIMTINAHKDEVLDERYTVKQIMDSWTVDSAGYPVVTVKRSGTDIIVSQQRYMLPHTNESDTTKWFIPITFATSRQIPSSEIPEYWLPNTEQEIIISNVVNESEWIYLNLNRSGYYRVNYENVSWKNLINNFEKLPEVARAMLIDDSFNLARVDLCAYDIPITMGMVLLRVPYDYLSWWAFANGLDYINNMLKREPAYESFRTLIKHIIKIPYNEMGFTELEDETDVELLHRARIIYLACEFGIDRCTNAAQLLFRDWIGNKVENKIPPNLKATIYCITLREGGASEWNFAFKQYQETTSASEKEILLSALGCTQKPWLLSKYLNLSITANSPVRKQDGSRAFAAVAKNLVGSELAFDFLYTNIAEIAEYFGDGFGTISKMIDTTTTFMNKNYHKEQFMRFAEKVNKLGLVAIEKSIKLAVIEIEKNIYWRDNLYPKVKDILDKAVQQLRLTA